jgi:hypothetical protein
MIEFRELVAILQASIGPVILISGVGLLLLSMTNRLARTVDRSRELADVLRQAPEAHRQRYTEQIRVLYQRARLVRSAISFATLSVLFAAILIISIFLSTFFHLEVVLLVVVLFICCMVSLIVSLAFFMRDINLALAALKVELESLR